MKTEGNNNQLELFSQASASSRKDGETGNIFSAHLLGHEKTIILIIGFILIGAVSFSLGVERGKKLALLQTKDFRVETAATNQQTTPIIRQKDIFKNKESAENTNRFVSLPQALPEPANRQKIAEKQTQKNERYTIQLACYKNSLTARNEAQKLKNKGHSALILTKGNYIVLCVGDFTDKEIAKTKLSELKKDYRDGIIRRL